MADDADRSDERIQHAIDDGIREARRAARELIPIGECHWCSETVAGYRLFCSTDCQTDYERDSAARIRNRGRK